MRPTNFDGVARCTRYAAGPNAMQLCGPDRAKEIAAYIGEDESDEGLASILTGFQTLYPYLKQIASANRIADPFDERVVEAYWIGNELLDAIGPQTYFRHLKDNLDLQRRLDPRHFDELKTKLEEGAPMHHTFHVLNVYKRTGHVPVPHTLDTMDSCRVSWGKVTAIDGPRVTVSRRPLALNGYDLSLGEAQPVTISRLLEEDGRFDDLRAGDLVTMHWGKLCEIINEQQAGRLARYTDRAIALANETM